MKKFFSLLFLYISLLSSEILIEDIRIIGLQRVSLGSVLDTIPVTIGDRIDTRDYQRVIRTYLLQGSLIM